MSRFVKQLMVLLAMLLAWSGVAMADNYWYKNMSGPQVSGNTDGSLTIKILTYDYDGRGLDDWLSYMDVYIRANGEADYTKVFTAKCKHVYDKGDFNNGYGNIYNTNSNYGLSSRFERDGDKHYRYVTIKMPEWIWGSVDVKTETDWRYSRLGGKNEYEREQKGINVGGCRTKLAPKCYALKPNPDGNRYQFNVKDIPQVKNCTTNLTVNLAGSTKTFSNIHCTDTLITMPVPSSVDIAKGGATLSAKVELKYCNNTASTASDVQSNNQITASAFVAVDNLTATYSSVNREVTLSWSIKNINESAYNYRVYRRTLNSSGTGITNYALVKSGSVNTDRNSSVTVTNGVNDSDPIETNKNYEYKVVMMPTRWTCDPKDSNWGGIESKTITTAPSIGIELQAVPQPHAVQLDWSIPHSTQFIGKTIEIYRKDAKNREVMIGSMVYREASNREDNGKGTFTDNGIEYDSGGELFSGKFKYWIVLRSASTWYACDFTSKTIDGTTTDVSYIKEVSASKGDFAGKVAVEWDLRLYKTNGSYAKSVYTVYRKQMEVEGAEYQQLTTFDSDGERLSFNDEEALPGIYYDYKVTMRTKATDGETEFEQSMYATGFSSAYGKVVGRITYGTGTAVSGVDVVALPTGNNDGSFAASRSLYFPNNGASAVCEFTEQRAKQYFGSNFTMQFWVNPLTKPLSVSTNPNEKDLHTLVNFCNHYRITLEPKTEGYLLGCSQFDTDGNLVDAKVLLDNMPADRFSHLSLMWKDNALHAVVKTPLGDEIADTICVLAEIDEVYQDDYQPVIKIGGGTLGLVDDMRIWKRALTNDEIASTYNTSLVGNETDLVAYWRFDEGLKSQFFDFSKSGTMMNANHGKLEAGVQSSTIVPEQSLLAYRCFTDVDGNYLIDGIPFASTGTSYSIVPSLGIHQFDPNKTPLFIGPDALVHNNVNFKDISSFPVSGTVYYKNTSYPVEGCTFYVDGQACTRDNKMVQSKEDGTFEIDVPIGKHKVEARIPNHDFGDDGLYEHDFNQRVTNLVFYDNTLVNLTGRVVGGNVEGNKPLGFGASEATIGKAVIELEPIRTGFSLNSIVKVNETMSWTENNPDSLLCPVNEGAKQTIESLSFRGGGDRAGKIFIHTDPKTGEFSAMLPPLEYRINSAKTKNHLVAENMPIDLASVVGVYVTDTLIIEVDDEEQEVEPELQFYAYNKALKLTYHSEPTFTVQQEDAEPGAFGMEFCEAGDLFGKQNLQIYDVLDDGSIKYNYGKSSDGKSTVPVFKMMDVYTFNMKGYEEYVNADDEDYPKTYTVPLVGETVTIRNGLSSDNPVAITDSTEYKRGDIVDINRDELVLDEKGECRYNWLCGFPNITPPHLRTISIDYTVGDSHKSWDGSGMEAVVIGNLPDKNNNFVTEGPDQVTFVLRDPPGSRSFAQWKSGTTSTFNRYYGAFGNSTNGVTAITHLTFENAVTIGAPGGPQTITKTKMLNDIKSGLSIKVGYEGGGTISTKTEVAQTISTSDSPNFVGSDGDIFIGMSSNMIFGKAENVGFWRTTEGEPFSIDLRNGVNTSNISFNTVFNYTQHYIVNYLIPNYKALLQSTLQYATLETIINFKNTTGKVVYLTPYQPGDKEYGTLNSDSTVWGDKAVMLGMVNGPSYWMILPEGVSEEETGTYRDDVSCYISQIRNWTTILANNEKDKVLAYTLRDDSDKDKRTMINNYSFDAGTKINYQDTYVHGEGQKHDGLFSVNIVYNTEWGKLINGAGIESHFETNSNAGFHDNWVANTDTTTVLAFTLAEDGTKDALSVDVMKSPSDWGFVFHTRGGQTSNPYEGEELTKYYEPGKRVLNEATMQIEKPGMTIDVALMNDVPVGGTANYTLRLTNESEIGENLSYILKVNEETNPNGAQLSVDGEPLTSAGRSIKVPYGTTVTKTLQLKQGQLGIVDYDDIELIFCSSSQSSLKVSRKISAHFVPTSTDVRMLLNSNVINTQSGTDFTVKFDSFDPAHRGLKAFRIQLKPEGALAWTTVKEFVLKQEDVVNDAELLPSGQPVAHTFSMKNYDDGRYLFRVISVSMNGGEELTASSDEMLVTKDMSRPTWISMPTPSNGILGIGDEVSLTFNEDINQGMIHKADNFILSGRLNGATVDHDGVYYNAGGKGARTQSSIDLSRRSFSIGAYVRWSQPGTIVRHGTASNNFSVAVQDNGKLQITVADKQYTTDVALPKDTWCYLNVGYDYDQDTPRLYVDYGDATGQYNMINGKQVATYDCSAPLVVGDSLTGVVHELTLWNYRRLPQVAFNEISLPKTASTIGLIGYWPLNEGHGNVGEDRARNRHLTIANNNSWHMEVGNYSLSLDGESYALLDMGNANTDVDSNYMLEFWTKANKQTAVATIIQTGDHQLELVANSDGMLSLNFAGQSKTITSKDFFSNTWHHVAINVLKGTSGTATLYIDGNAMLQVPATQLPPLQGNKLIVGAHRTIEDETYKTTYSQYYKGMVDEVRLWKGTFSAATIREKIYTRVLSDTEGLKSYYPFELTTLDSFNQPTTSPSLVEQSAQHAAEAKVYKQEGEAAQKEVTDWSSNDAPGLKQAKLLANLDFQFTTSDRRIRIDLTDDAERLEGSMLTFTVRNVQDLNGNVCEPITWTAYVDRCPMVWENDQVDVTVDAGKTYEFTAVATNRSGDNVDWYLTGMPMWLTASIEGGTLKPTGTQTIRFTIANGVAIGRYEGIVKLISSNGVASNLIVNLKVQGDKPDWKVDGAKYEHSMNVIGKIMLDNMYSDDPDDIIAAFVGSECRGVAQPVYYPRYDSYITMLTIYGDGSDQKKDLTFKMYDASSGLVYPKATANPAIVFGIDGLEGSMTSPVIWTVDDSREQSQTLNEGWNWISMYVLPEKTDVASVMNSIGGKGSLMKCKNESAVYDEGAWYGSMQMQPETMYKVKMAGAADWTMSGAAIATANVPITIAHGWNWIGFPSSAHMSVEDAFAYLAPQSGDVVKGRNGFAMYDDFGWAGTLTALQPGQGYVYKSVDSVTKTFTYPTVVRNSAPMRSPQDGKHKYTPCDPHKYEGNMTVIAQVRHQDELLDCEIAAFDENGECRAGAFTQGERKLAFLTIQGEGNGETLHFRVVFTDENGEEHDVETLNSLEYENDAIVGKPSAPFGLLIDNVGWNGVHDITESTDERIYNLTGVQVTRPQHGVYIRNGVKLQVSGFK